MSFESLIQIVTFSVAWTIAYLTVSMRHLLAEAVAESLRAWTRWMQTMIKPKQDDMQQPNYVRSFPDDSGTIPERGSQSPKLWR